MIWRDYTHDGLDIAVSKSKGEYAICCFRSQALSPLIFSKTVPNLNFITFINGSAAQTTAAN